MRKAAKSSACRRSMVTPLVEQHHRQILFYSFAAGISALQPELKLTADQLDHHEPHHEFSLAYLKKVKARKTPWMK
jgi:hypothetical protein